MIVNKGRMIKGKFLFKLVSLVFSEICVFVVGWMCFFVFINVINMSIVSKVVNIYIVYW